MGNVCFEGFAETEEWLRGNVPAQEVTGIIHGDVGTPNMMFRHGPPPKLAAMIDWELSTIGDPMFDLGWFTGGMRDEDDPDKAFPTALQDPALFPTKQELAGGAFGVVESGAADLRDQVKAAIGGYVAAMEAAFSGEAAGRIVLTMV